MLFALIFGVFLIGILTILILDVVKPNNFPLGPRWLPLIGSSGAVRRMVNLHGSYPGAYEGLAKLHKTEVLGLKLGRELAVVIYGADNIKEALTNSDFDERPDNYFTKLRCFGKKIEEQLRVVCLDIIIAGSQSSSNVLEFCLLALVLRPEAQQRIYEELCENIGDSTPCWTDSYRCRYTSSFIKEVERYYNVAPLLGPRRASCATKIGGYDIPKGTTVMIGVGALHKDKRVWGEDQFLPERFMKPREHFYPFGAGRRRCPGDSLGKSYVFIALASILQRFKVSARGTLDDTPWVSLLSSPRPFEADFVPRA